MLPFVCRLFCLFQHGLPSENRSGHTSAAHTGRGQLHLGPKRSILTGWRRQLRPRIGRNRTCCAKYPEPQKTSPLFADLLLFVSRFGPEACKASGTLWAVAHVTQRQAHSLLACATSWVPELEHCVRGVITNPISTLRGEPWNVNTSPVPYFAAREVMAASSLFRFCCSGSRAGLLSALSERNSPSVRMRTVSIGMVGRIRHRVKLGVGRHACDSVMFQSRRQERPPDVKYDILCRGSTGMAPRNEI